MINERGRERERGGRAGERTDGKEGRKGGRTNRQIHIEKKRLEKRERHIHL